MSNPGLRLWNRSAEERGRAPALRNSAPDGEAAGRSLTASLGGGQVSRRVMEDFVYEVWWM